MENKNTMLRRHTIDAMLMHWFNTICWIILLSTGIGLINNPVLQPFGMWWVRIMHALFGGGAELLQFHKLQAKVLYKISHIRPCPL